MSDVVAFYMHDFSGGGVERMRLALMAELRARGFSICLIVERRAGPLVALLPEGLQVIELNTQGMLPCVRPLAAVLRQLRPQFLVSSLDHNNITAILACCLARTGTRVVICQHNALSAEKGLGWRYRAVPWMYWALQRGAHGIVAVSRGVAEDLAVTAGIAEARISVIYNPVIGPDFAARAAGPVPHPWLGDSSLQVCVFAGRLVAQKDPDLALEAIALLPGVRLIMLGEGERLAALKALADRLGIASRVAFVGYQSNPLPWLASATCLVSTSRHEGLGNALIEALALGTPVVATDCPHGPAEILLDGALGELVPVGNPRELADAIRYMLSRPPDRAALRARGAQFSAAACAEAHLELFARAKATAAPRRAFGLPFEPLVASQVADVVFGPVGKAGPRLVVTPNVDHIRLLRRASFRAAYRAADIVCPDGLPVLAYARWRGLKLGARVTGCEIYQHLAEHPGLAAKNVLIVAESERTTQAVHSWAMSHGLKQFSAITAPSFLSASILAQADLAKAIAAAAPDILVMTLGAPVSEEFVHRYRAKLPACWALCLGQAVRIHLGLVHRAPTSWQKLGLEWLWRIRQEPRRLAGRYLRAFAWFPIAILADLGSSRDQPSA